MTLTAAGHNLSPTDGLVGLAAAFALWILASVAYVSLFRSLDAGDGVQGDAGLSISSMIRRRWEAVPLLALTFGILGLLRLDAWIPLAIAAVFAVAGWRGELQLSHRRAAEAGQTVAATGWRGRALRAALLLEWCGFLGLFCWAAVTLAATT